MIFEIIITCVIGTLLHFTYDWSNHNKVVGLFSAVNESTWEHIKMGLSAILLCSLVDGYFLGNNPNYFFAKFISLIVFIIIIPIIFYGYNNITKRPILFVDITSFFIAIILCNLVFYKILNIGNLSYIFNYIGCIGLFFIFGFYMTATLMPISNFLFKDPITKLYGIKAHK